MKFCIVTHVVHTQKENKIYGYAPYINEMNIWLKYVDEVYIIAPKENRILSEIDSFYVHQKINFIDIPSLHFKSLKSFFRSIWNSFKILIILFKIYSKVDHIHLRCPGNIALLGTIAQIFFPKKKKTAKYAGNWDPNSKQPLSYRIQKQVLANTFLTKNIKVLVYGKWNNSTKNIYPFFTATYSESEKKNIEQRDLNNEIKFLFAGTLSDGKNPFYAIDLVNKLYEKGFNVRLDLYGDGYLKQNLQLKILKGNLEKFISLQGNVNKEKMKENYQQSHFLILPSESEGWPKVIAEAMFWGCLPISTPVSCLPFMLDNENRGVLLKQNIENDSEAILNLINTPILYQEKCKLAINWSQEFTLEKFEKEIKNLI